jgi:hypothetical protein
MVLVVGYSRPPSLTECRVFAWLEPEGLVKMQFLLVGGAREPCKMPVLGALQPNPVTMQFWGWFEFGVAKMLQTLKMQVLLVGAKAPWKSRFYLWFETRKCPKPSSRLFPKGWVTKTSTGPRGGGGRNPLLYAAQYPQIGP